MIVQPMGPAWHFTVLQIAAVIVLDLLLGDPLWLPHPVRLIGAAISAGECRLHTGKPAVDFRRGTILASSIIIGAAASTWALIALVAQLNRSLGAAAAVMIAWTTLGMRGLDSAAREIEESLDHNDTTAARRALPALVGRDPDSLDRRGIVRATVESVAENASDAVVAPLFYLFMAGPAGAIAYKAINTLDSMIGHRNQRFLFFGRAAARFDDAANYIPARLTATCLIVTATVFGNAYEATRVCASEACLHASPNAGYPEAAVAGGLGIWLGGDATYGGEIERRSRLNVGGRDAVPGDICDARRMMLTGSVIAFCVLALCRETLVAMCRF